MSSDSSKPIIYPLPFIEQDITQWPIYRLSEEREAFTDAVKKDVLQKVLTEWSNKQRRKEELSKILYGERIRLIEKRWKADPPDESAFWSRIKSKIIKLDQIGLEEKERPKEEEIIEEIVDRYVQEIVGTFDPRVFKFARFVLPQFFSRVLNAAPGGWFKNLSRNWKTIHEKIPITGDIAKIRALAERGTVIVTPTHFSNMDSIMVGWVLSELGLPAFTYGAGLNLFSIKLLSFFMSSLGAYKVDRRKKNSLYLDTLKTYSCGAIERGAHMIFFPGGTRSRSGSLERKLKLGLLGTAVEAQKNHFKKYPEGSDVPKVFVVPCVINYHFVLEAEGLINDWLKEVGKEKFLRENDSYSTSFKMLKFMYKFLSASSSLAISFGEPMDVLGNRVDAEGGSYNHLGQKMDLRRYFMTHGELTDDAQREGEYTRILGERIVENFFRFNVVLSSHLVCFTCFELLRKQFLHVDLFTLLRAPAEDLTLNRQDVRLALNRVLIRLRELADKGDVQLSPDLNHDTDWILQDGIRNIDLYHAQSPLFADGDTLGTEDVKLLYYYRNRLEGYRLEKWV